MPISLDEYRLYIKKRKFVQNPSHYKMDIFGKDGQIFVCYPDSILIPGRNFINTPFSYYGPEFSFPLRREYNELSANFLVYQDWKERTYFESWMDSILPFDTESKNVGVSDIIPTDLLSKMKKIQIVFNSRQKTENSNSINAILDLFECYPSLITPTQFSSDNSGYTLFTVNFAFKYYTFKSSSDTSTPEIKSF
jgi:hypothetical protein